MSSDNPQLIEEKNTPGKFASQIFIICLAAFALRVGLALPALAAGTVFRPDSPTYWEPAMALINGDFTGFINAVRTPGYPLFLAIGIKLFGGNLALNSLLGMVLSSLTVIPVALTVSLISSRKAGLFAGWIYALSITSIAVSPLILSDTLLGLAAAWQLYWAIKFLQNPRWKYMALFTLTAIAGYYIKPINLLVILAGVPVIAATAKNWKIFWQVIVTMLIMFAVLLLPYLIHCYKIFGGMDGNTANIYFHNGSAVMAFVTKESSEIWRHRLLTEAEETFAKDPEKYANDAAQNRWKQDQFKAMIKKYPIAFVVTHLPNPGNLLPDVPSLLENNHLTRTGQGTMAVLRQKGLIAATDHYLQGKWYLLAMLAPLLLVTGVTYLLAFWRLCCAVRYWYWRELLVFGVMVFYYIWAPGPVISPRYLLPALPMLIMMAAIPKKIKI